MNRTTFLKSLQSLQGHSSVFILFSKGLSEVQYTFDSPDLFWFLTKKDSSQSNVNDYF